MNIIHVRKGGLSWFLVVPHLITYWKFGSVFKSFQDLRRPTIVNDATCAYDKGFAHKCHERLWKLFYKQENILKINNNEKR